MEPIFIPIVALIVIIYAMLVFLHPRMAIYLLIFFSVFDLGFFSRWIGATRYLARIPFFLSGLLALIFILYFFSGKLKIWKKDRLIGLSIKFIFLLTILAITSNLYNNENLVLGIYELRYFYMMAIFIISFSYYLPERTTIKNFILFCAILGLLQIPFTVFQYVLVQFMGIRLSQSALDMSSGTFADYSALVFLQCIAIACILEYQLNFKKPLLKMNNYFVAFLLIVPLLFSYSRSALGFVIATVIFVFSRDMFKNMNPIKVLKRSIILVSICFICLFAFLHFFYEVHQFSQQLNMSYVVDYMMQEPKSLEQYQAGRHGVMGRGRAIYEAITLVSANFFNFLFGMGSGSTAEASFIGAKGKFFYEYGPMAGIGRTQISKIIVEMGFLGLFLTGYFFVNIFFLSKTIPENIPRNILIKNMFLNTMFIVFLSALYSPILASEISMLTIGFLIAIMNRVTNETVPA